MVVAFDSEPRVTTVKAACQQLDIPWKYGYELIRDGKFPVRTIRVNRRILVPRAELDALLGLQPKSDAA